MDNERARFILRSFRPDGADADDRDFAEALELAVRDRELGEWLARERELDAGFARALERIELPAGLREDILRAFAAAEDGPVRFDDPLDGSMAGALGSLRAPAELRERVLVAMERTARDGRGGSRWWRRLGFPLAAAAGIALAFVLTRGPLDGGRTAATKPVPLEYVQAGFVKTYESPGFRLDIRGEDANRLVGYLRSQELPCPGCLPKGLQGIPGIGCRELVIDGKRGSLICFDTREQGVVHLLVFRREDIEGEVPPPERPDFAEQNGWAAARWAEGKRAFILLGHGSAEDLARLL